MPILSITTDMPGQIGVVPRIVRINTTDSFATITAANYLSGAIKEGFTFYPSDLFAVTYGSNVTQLFTVTITSTAITLVPNESSVILPVTDGDFAIFSGTAGALQDKGFSPSDATKSKVAMVTTTTTNGNIAQFNDTSGTVGNGPIAANKVLTSAITTPDVGANLISFDVTVGQAALAAGGSVTIIASTGSKQYKIRSLQLNGNGTNFSGGSGNRLGQVTDNTSVYSLIPAATMQALANSRWGDTALPFPASVALNTSTAAGASLVFKYSGGTTDYTAGSLVISGIVERIA